MNNYTHVYKPVLPVFLAMYMFKKVIVCSFATLIVGLILIYSFVFISSANEEKKEKEGLEKFRKHAELASLSSEQFYSDMIVKRIQTDVFSFKYENKKLPLTLEELLAWLKQKRGEAIDKDYAVDGWGKTVKYTNSGKSCVITSLGKDGQEGGFGEDADLSEHEDI